ncbi:type II toxin-antitoxin system HicB family antitoxin [Candidatus Amarolinea dominans]|uniref:type II toxin-antitoxin system HicB family antitoxin n=1 Tax=Candidatus Amarolinea dominans TaxID=3140696 RepID=UPI0031371170|nr:type II toxin-antitoxin system HicB family antitoxin [Anaerolineae bacterium]
MATYKITLEIEHLPEGPYLGTSPDLPGLIVQAETAEEVIRLAPDIAADLIQVMQEMGQPLPTQLVTLLTPLRVPIAVPA